MRARSPIPKSVQVKVFKRDGWLCRYCGMPVVFDPAMKLLEQWLSERGVSQNVALYDLRRRRDRAPLLDQLGVAVDHRVAHASGGADTEKNLVTACNKCNARKSSTDERAHSAKNPRRSIKSRYGEPTTWDGFSSLFIALASADPGALSATEKDWLRALRASGSGDAP